MDRHAADWSGFVCACAGLPPGTPAVPLDADLSTVSPRSDKLFRVGPPAGGLVHLELQAGRAADLPAQLHLYNTLAEYRHPGPVRTVLLLLRPEADGPTLSGTFTRADEAGEYLRLRYRVVRLWQLPCELLLTGPPGLIPFGLLTDDARPGLADNLRRVDDRLQAAGLGQADHAEVLTACQLLLGLRYDGGMVRDLFGRLRVLRESSGYQLILDEGRQEGRAEGELRGLREAILDAGEGKFGPPPADAEVRLDAIADRNHLRRMTRRVAAAVGWDDLLGTP